MYTPISLGISLSTVFSLSVYTTSYEINPVTDSLTLIVFPSLLNVNSELSNAEIVIVSVLSLIVHVGCKQVAVIVLPLAEYSQL